MVCGRTRLSAKATSSGSCQLRKWASIVMGRPSSRAFRVKGLVGLVDEGRQCGTPVTRMMSGAWPPPAPSTWYMWIVRPPMAAMVSSQ